MFRGRVAGSDGRNVRTPDAFTEGVRRAQIGVLSAVIRGYLDGSAGRVGIPYQLFSDFACRTDLLSNNIGGMPLDDLCPALR